MLGRYFILFNFFCLILIIRSLRFLDFTDTSLFLLVLDEGIKYCVQFNHSLEADLLALKHYLLSFDLVDLDGVCNYCHDKLYFVEKNFVVFQQLSKHELSAVTVQSCSKFEKLL